MTFEEESLDPQNWDEMRALGHRMIDDMLTYLQTVRERPVWQPTPDRVKQQLKAPLPVEPQSAAAAYQDFIIPAVKARFFQDFPQSAVSIEFENPFEQSHIAV